MADPVPTPAVRPAVRSWENEGGALSTFAGALPVGITTRMVRQYCVGRYCYSDLALAIAERDRQYALGSGPRD